MANNITMLDLENPYKNINAIAGYEFVCKNENCPFFNRGFTFYRDWPISDIETIIQLKDAPEDLKQHLLKCRNEGKKYALTILPNVNNIPIVGKRIQLFCKKDCIIWERDLVNKNSIIDVYCDKCKGKLLTADEAKENGILCPSCRITLSYNTFFSKI